MSLNKNTRNQIWFPLVLMGGLAIGFFLGAGFFGRTTFQPGAKEVQKLREVLSRIERDYVDTVEMSPLIDVAITEILDKLDPHSSYISASDRIQANEDLQGNFEGIGIEFNIFHDTIVVVSPLSGGPSEEVGLISGDQIIKVDDNLVAGIGISTLDVMKALKGPKGTRVKIHIKRGREKEFREFEIIRDKIPQFSVDAAYMIGEDIGYIKISRFSATTFEEYTSALEKLKGKGMAKLVIDLQGNPGGYMTMAIDIADDFLPENKMIVETKSKDGRYNAKTLASKKGNFEKGDLIILVNEGSASASEILAGALQDNDRALLVGRRSFGKGLVQAPFELSDGSELRLTISRYYTPSGRSIQKPYTDEEEYAKDIISRYNHGEFFHADSIRFNDSLKYETLQGRIVYGGGGIMPDYFVPLDTSLSSPYLNELYNSSSIQEYTFQYAEKNESALDKMGFEKFKNAFTVSDAMLKELAETGKRNQVDISFSDLLKEKKVIQLHIKAQIARKIWGSEGFYPIINGTNEILNQALKLFDRIPTELNHTKI